MVGVHDTFQGYDTAGLSLECGHGSGYIHCVGGEEWARLGSGPTEATVPSTSPATTPIEHWSILREFQDNQVAADAKYGGKRVTLVGEMDFVLVENGRPVVRMSVPAWSGRQMFCVFPIAQKAAVAMLKANQKVVMECTVLGIAGGVSRVGRGDLGSSVGRLTLDNCALK